MIPTLRVSAAEAITMAISAAAHAARRATLRHLSLEKAHYGNGE
ncbi:MAG: hypothetical protein R6X06_03435 [Gammaproteobacteria bacterium]